MPKRANKRKDAMIKLERVEKRYGQGPYVLAGIDLEVARGDVLNGHVDGLGAFSIRVV